MKKHIFAPIVIDKTCYRIDGRPVYLYSGEFHYFRVPKKDWRRRMRLFRAAGGNCIATYVPWLIHEPEENRFVFGGKDGTHDIEGFLRTAAEEGLYVIARPGPYQYSELKYEGLPGWLCENYPELRAQDIEGKAFRTSSISYLHPLFLEKVRRWFGEVVPRIASHTVAKGGPVAFVQFDNELGGIHCWFGGLDYNTVTMGFGEPDGRYPRWLRGKYGDVRSLNRAYGTRLASFEDARPESSAAGSGAADLRRRRDYFLFYLSTLAEYGKTLADMMRGLGIDVPFVHNSANPSMNGWFCDLVRAMRGSFLLGSDHYYSLGQEWAQNNPTPQYAVNCFYSLEMLRLMGFPPTVYELPGGSASDWPPITPEDAKASYLANVALGMKGSNFYILTGGPNIPGTGMSGDVYDYGASIGPFGEIRPLYKVQKEVGLFLRKNSWLMEAERECDFRIGLDFSHTTADQYWKNRGEFLLSDSEAWTFTQRGLLSTAFCASLSPVFVDLDSDDWRGDLSTPLVIVSSACMARKKQERLVGFLKAGGRLLIAPVLPTHDENLEPCAILSEFLRAPRASLDTNQFVRITVGGVVNICNTGQIYSWDKLPRGAKIVGVDEITGSTLAWRNKLPGGGEVLCLGFRWSHGRREHERMLVSLLRMLGLQQKVHCSNPNVWTSLRSYRGKSSLFIMNLLSAPMEADISCRPGSRRDVVSLGSYRLKPMEVKVVMLPSAGKRGHAISS